jgi:5-amino-6-(5-phosphoribosylamino)uracil reductase
VLADLRERGVARLLAEGGSSVLTQLLAQGLVDELLVSIAPIFVGDSAAPRFVGDGSFPFSAGSGAPTEPQGAAGLPGAAAQQQAGGGGRRMTLAGVRQLGDCVRIRYLLTHEDGR